MSDDATEPEVEQPPPTLTINQVVALNLMRARRRQGWTQEETAGRLSEATGRRWTNATLSAAERSWQTGRVREFNANELIAFATIFRQPLAYFFLPPEGADRQFLLGPVGQVDTETPYGKRGRDSGYLTAVDVLAAALPLRITTEVASAAEEHLTPRNIAWSPPRAGWLRPEEAWNGPESEGGLEPPHPDLTAVRAALVRALQVLDAIENPELAPDVRNLGDLPF